MCTTAFSMHCPHIILAAPPIESSAAHHADRHVQACRPCAAEFGQCGGSPDAPTCCIDGLECVFQNQFYSQCLTPVVA